LGSYRDTCVKVGGAWLIREKIIDPWSGASVPAGGAFAL
jgi:ribose 5-phosphate isomerase